MGRIALLYMLFLVTSCNSLRRVVLQQVLILLPSSYPPILFLSWEVHLATGPGHASIIVSCKSFSPFWDGHFSTGSDRAPIMASYDQVTILGKSVCKYTTFRRPRLQIKDQRATFHELLALLNVALLFGIKALKVLLGRATIQWMTWKCIKNVLLAWGPSVRRGRRPNYQENRPWMGHNHLTRDQAIKLPIAQITMFVEHISGR